MVAVKLVSGFSVLHPGGGRSDTFGEEPKHGEDEYDYEGSATYTLGSGGAGCIEVKGVGYRNRDPVHVFSRSDEMQIFARFR